MKKKLFTLLMSTMVGLGLAAAHPEGASADSPASIETTRPHAFDMDSHAERALMTPSLPSSPAPLFREVPSLSGRYSAQDLTLMPYIGAGFGGGFASDLDRTLGLNSSLPNSLGSGNLLRQNVAPSELQLGIRVPF